MLYLMEFLYFFIPAAAISWFVVSLCLYLSAKKNKRQPGSVSSRVMKTRKIMLIVSSVIAGVLAVIVLAFMALLFMAVAFM